MAAPVPSTLRITDGRQVKVEDHVVKNKALQLTIDKAHATLDSGYWYVFNLYLLFLSLFSLILILILYMDLFSQWFNCSCSV